MRRRTHLLLLVGALAAACDGDAGEDAGAPAEDAGPGTDAGPTHVADWSCLDGPTMPEPSGPTASVTLRLTDSGRDDAPIEGVGLTVCAVGDVDCATPLVTSATDADGTSRFDVDTTGVGALVYVRATHPDYPTHVYRSATPILGELREDFAMLREASVGGLLIGLGEDQDFAANGMVVAIAHDCADRGAPGVRVELEPSVGRAFYVDGPVASRRATATDETGAFGVLNVPPGRYALRLFTETDRPYSALEIPLEAGELTALVMLPTPGGEVLRP